MSDQSSRTDREYVAGIRVATRRIAMQRTPLAPDRDLPLTGVDEVLLDNGNTVFQCVALDTCHRVWPTPESARAHLAAHSAKRTARRLKKELDVRTAQLEQSYRTRSDAARRGHVTRRSRKSAVDTPATETPAAQARRAGRAARSSASRPANVERRAKLREKRTRSVSPAEMHDRLDDVISRLAETFAEFTTLVLELRRIRDDVARLGDADPELVAKAERYDQLKGLLGDTP